MSCCDTLRGARLFLFLLRRPDIVAMETAVAMNRRGNRAHRLAKPLRYSDFLPGARIERRENRASFVLVLSGQIQIQATMNATKQESCFQWRPLSIVGRTRSMLRNQQFVCASLAQHLNSHQDWGHHNCMQAIYSDGLHRMQPLDWLTIFLGERDVSPKFSDRAARLQPAHNIAFRKVLVFQAYRRMGEDASFFQHAQRLPRQPQAQCIWQSLLLHDNNTLLVSGGMPYVNRAAEGSPNHLLGAASPAFIKSWIFDQDGQVVTAPVVSTVRAGWATRDVVPANLPDPPYVLQNAEF